MPLSSQDLKAINWFCLDRDLKPALSVPPQMYFNSRSNGEPFTFVLTDIIESYNSWKKEDQKQRARDRKAEAKQ